MRLTLLEREHLLLFFQSWVQWAQDPDSQVYDPSAGMCHAYGAYLKANSSVRDIHLALMWLLDRERIFGTLRNKGSRDFPFGGRYQFKHVEMNGSFKTCPWRLEFAQHQCRELSADLARYRKAVEQGLGLTARRK